MSLPRPLLSLLIALGVAARIAAVTWNDLPHGDVHLDLLTVREVVAGEGLRTPLERAVELYPPVDERPGHPLDQHPPLVVLLAAPLVPLAGDPYRALQLVSLLASLLAIGAAAWSAARVFGRELALPAAALVASSYVLIDFAGNGSIYALQTLLVLLLPGVATLRGGAFVAGGVCALAWLTNYQAAVYAVAVGLAPLVARGRRGIGAAAAAAFGFAVVAAPWWGRNLLLFGDPFFSVNPLYLRARFGGVPGLVEEGGVLRLVMEGPALGTLATAFVQNLIVNVRFVATQTPLWLGPLLLAGVAGAVAAVRRGRERAEWAPVLLLLLPALHLATMLVWPACKFRYVAPLAALAVLPALGWLRERGASSRLVKGAVGAVAFVVLAVAVERLLRGGARDGAVVLALLGLLAWSMGGARRAVGLFVALQVGLVVASAPTLSTYYDGIVVADVFGRRDAEAADRARQRDLAALAERLALPPGTAVVGDVELASHLGPGVRVVQPPPFDDPAIRARVWEHLRGRYGELRALVERDEAGEAERALRGVVRLEEAPEATEGAFALFRLLP